MRSTRVPWGSGRNVTGPIGAGSVVLASATSTANLFNTSRTPSPVTAEIFGPFHAAMASGVAESVLVATIKRGRSSSSG